MFDIGFWELATLAVIALLIVGPERLPKIARDAVRVMRMIQRFIQNARDELQKELQIDEVNDLQQNIDYVEQLMRQAPDRVMQNIDKDTSDK